MESLMYPALQKFYSSLKHLDNFKKENNFFDNISSLDSFFSEFRNVTFVLQKSVAHTEFEEVYPIKKDEYFSDCKWFIDKRNEITKQQPFNLTKVVCLTVYCPNQKLKVTRRKFTIENDVEIKRLLNSMKDYLSSFNSNEVFFSAEFSFFEGNSDVDIYDRIVFGVKQMYSFLKDMYGTIGEDDVICRKLFKQIEESLFWKPSKDLFFVNDYVYYPQSNTFEIASTITAGVMPVDEKIPLKSLNDRYAKFKGDYFKAFILMHVVIGKTDLMPTIMTVYNDETFRLDTFHSDIKTTMYRKINEIANEISKGEIKEVYLMLTYISINKPQFCVPLVAPQRMALSSNEHLVFMKLDNKLNAYECSFDKKLITDNRAIFEILSKNIKSGLELGAVNARPIIKAFEELKNNME